MAKSVKRLYEQFHPEHYDLKLDPDRDKLNFVGSVIINGQKVGKPSKRLTFHQKGLKFAVASLTKHTKAGEEVIEVERTNNHEKLNEVRIHTAETLYPGRYTVKFEFSGVITESMLGIYASNFKHDGKNKRLIATQFESHYAREAFPCIDEPEAKATFDLSLTTAKDDIVLGNTPVKHEKITGSAKTTVFETTPKMSTYLLAFVYGEMQSVEAKTKDGVLVRNWCSAAQDKRFLQYSVDEAVRILDFFTDYFGVSFPLPKCDQVALPDFDAGAMENWGLITYREIALLADPDNRSVSGEQYVSMVVAHELSHQWFGNLVTMKWWDDLWLNESFASLMEHLALAVIHPDWNQWELYTAADVISTSSRDVYSDVQPVAVTVTDPDLIDTLFDPGIVYAKGGRLLKMLRDHIGDDAFAKGLRSYFKTHAYANASRNDLWKALSAASGKDLVALMDPWIVNAGMPMLEVTQKDRKLHVSQRRFLLDEGSDERIWPVPMLADQKLTPDILNSQSADVEADNSSYVLLNQYGSGHYFVRYTEAEHRDYITKRLRERHLPTEARINILNDYYMLARKGAAPLTDALEIVVGCQTEDRDSVWAAITRIIVATGQLTEGDETAEQQLKALRRQLGQHWFEKLGWHDQATDDPNTKQLRHSALAYMVAGEDPAALKQALQLYQKTPDLKQLPAEIRSTILSAAVRHGPPETVDKLLATYPVAVSDIQLDITSALASTKAPKTAEHIYGQALGPNGFVRKQDIMRWLAVFIRNHHIRNFVWDYIVKNWDWIESALGESKSFDYLPVYCAAVFNTPEGEKKYHDFFEPKKDTKTLKRNILVGYADIAARVNWRKREEQQLLSWLAGNIKSKN